MVSPAQKFATEQYKRRHYDFTAVRLPTGQRQLLKEYAYSTGRSLSGLIIQAIRELLEREKRRTAAYLAANLGQEPPAGKREDV